MALQTGVHESIELAEFPRVGADQVRPEFADAGPDAVRVCRQVKRPERADFAVPDNTRVGLDPDDGTIEHRNRLPAGPLVRRFVQREFDTVRENAGDLHGALGVIAGGRQTM